MSHLRLGLHNGNKWYFTKEVWLPFCSLKSKASARNIKASSTNSQIKNLDPCCNHFNRQYVKWLLLEVKFHPTCAQQRWAMASLSDPHPACVDPETCTVVSLVWNYVLYSWAQSGHCHSQIHTCIRWGIYYIIAVPSLSLRVSHTTCKSHDHNL